MRAKPTIIPASEMTMKHLEETMQQLFQQHVTNYKNALLFGRSNAEWVKTVDLKPLEFNEGSIVTQGFTLDERWKPTYIVFKTKHNRRKVKVIDFLITPEVAILYVDKDTRKWLHTKGCTLLCDRQAFYTGGGIMSQIDIAHPQRTVQLQHPSFDDP